MTGNLGWLCDWLERFVVSSFSRWKEVEAVGSVSHCCSYFGVETYRTSLSCDVQKDKFSFRVGP